MIITSHVKTTTRYPQAPFRHCNNYLILRFTSAPAKSTTIWESMSKKRITLETIFSESMRPTIESSLPPELLLQFPTSAKSSLSAPKNTDRELSTSSANTPDAPPVPHQDGLQELLPIKSPRNSNSQDSWSSPIPRVTTKPSSRLHTSTFPALLCVTPMLLWNLLTSLFLATTEFLSQFLWFSGCWLEKWWF